MAKRRARSGPVPVQSVGRSLDLLEAVAAEELGLVALSERTGLGPSTAYRLLGTLMERGYVTRNPGNGRFRPGHKLVELAAATERDTERLRAAARPHLERLRDATEETANLVILDGLSIVYVDQVESLRAVRMFTTIGRRVPLHASAAGKAILAAAPPSLLEDVVDEGLARLTANTVRTPKALRTELELTRTRGFAIDDEEYEEGVICVAAPIVHAGGEPIAAASVSGPSARMVAGDLDAIGRLVQAQMLEVSKEMGAIAPAGTASV